MFKDFEDKLVYLIGKPGSGKYTIAHKICAKTNAILIDNHKINNLIFDIVKLTDKNAHILWPRIDRIREVVFKTIEDSRPQGTSFVLTNVLMADDPDDIKWFHEIQEMAKKSKLDFYPVILTPSNEKILEHIDSKDRFERHKLSDKDFFKKRYASREVYIPKHKNTILIDNTALSAEEAIIRILKELN